MNAPLPPPARKWPLEKTTRVVLFGAALALLGVGLVSLRSLLEFGTAADRVAHSHRVIAQAERVLADAAEVQNGQRGYLITGDQRFLDSYLASRAGVEPHMRQLRKLTADNPGQQRRLDALDGLVANRLAITDGQIELRRTQGFAAVPAALIEGRGRTAMAQTRALMQEILDEEGRRLTELNAQTKASARLTLAALGSLGALALGFLGLAGRRILREMTGRDAAKARVELLHAELAALNASLEQRVAARTAELQREIDERTRLEAHTRAQLEQLALTEAEGRRLLATAEKSRRALLSVAEDHRQAEAALLHSEARFRRVVESDMLGIIFWNAAGEITGANDAFLRIVGYSRDDLHAGRVDWRNLTPPEYQARDEIALRDVAATGVCAPYEKAYLHQDGSCVPILIGGAALPGAPGEGVAFVLDITARKRAEEDIVLWKNRYEAVVKASGQLLYDWDPGSNEVAYGGALERVLGYRIEEMTGGLAHWLELVHPDDRDSFNREIARVMAAKQSFHLGYRIRRKDGSYIFTQDDGYFTFDGLGNVTRMVGFVIDITARRQAEAARRAAEEKYHSIFEHAVEGIYQSTPEGRYLTVNPAMARIYGYTSPEAMTRAITDIGRQLYAEPDDRRRLQTLLHAQGGSGAFECRMRRQDGALIWIRQSARAVRDETGEVIRYDGSVEDITARKRVEAALRESEERFHKMFRSSPAAVCMNTVDSGRLIEVNDRYCEFLGYGREELVGRTIFELDLWEDPAQRAPVIRALKAGGVVRNAEVRMRRHSGAVRDVLMSLELLELAGEREPVLISIFTDITELKVAVAALRASGEQLRALAGRLQAIREEERTGIAREIHDVLAQELTRLKLDLSWLDRRAARPVDERTRAEVREKIASMMELSDITITTVHTLATNLRPVVLDSLGLGSAIEWLAEEFQGRTGVVCTVRVAAGLPALERAQDTALFRIVQESLTNVTRHAGARRVEVTLESGATGLCLTVRDDGRGITAAELRDPKSIGLLGMKERAALLGGVTEIAPAPGGGTIVRVTTPLPANSGEKRP